MTHFIGLGKEEFELSKRLPLLRSVLAFLFSLQEHESSPDAYSFSPTIQAYGNCCTSAAQGSTCSKEERHSNFFYQASKKLKTVTDPPVDEQEVQHRVVVEDFLKD